MSLFLFGCKFMLANLLIYSNKVIFFLSGKSAGFLIMNVEK